jgi:predicted hydrocarbon binding protein
VDEVYCSSARGFFRGAIDLLTGGTTEVSEPRCQCRGDEACVFSLRWTVPAVGEEAAEL